VRAEILPTLSSRRRGEMPYAHRAEGAGGAGGGADGHLPSHWSHDVSTVQHYQSSVSRSNDSFRCDHRSSDLRTSPRHATANACVGENGPLDQVLGMYFTKNKTQSVAVHPDRATYHKRQPTPRRSISSWQTHLRMNSLKTLLRSACLKCNRLQGRRNRHCRGPLHRT
jgi:hypothetical protein